MDFEEYMKINGERLLSLSPIKKSKENRVCFSCEEDIPLYKYFCTMVTLIGVTEENKIVNINNYTVCKKCSIKITSDPIFPNKPKPKKIMNNDTKLSG
tara:strand:- start:13 stop:306 length:294 start_codon:yes stop_codon:yes gene_type:complete